MGICRDWVIEFDGRQVGRLTNPQYEEMFWERYDIECEPGSEEVVFDAAKWEEMVFVIRDPESGEVADGYFSDGFVSKNLEKSQIALRALYTASDGEDWQQKKDARERRDRWIKALVWIGAAVAFLVGIMIASD